MAKTRKTNALTNRMAAAALAFGLAGGIAAPALAQSDLSTSFDRNAGTQTTGIQVAQADPAQVRGIVRDVEQGVVATKTVSHWEVHFNPMVPIALIAGLGLAYGGFCMVAARRRMRGSWLRAAAGGALVLTLLNPEIRAEQRDILPTEVVIVVDKTASQNLDDRATVTGSTYEALITQLNAISGLHVRVVEVDGQKDGVAQDGTQLFSTLEASMTDVPRDRLGAIIMLTDGQIHDIPPDASIFGRNVPLHVLVSGRENETDRRIVIDQAPRFGLVGQEQTITFRVLDDGVQGAGTPLRVTVSADGQDLGSQTVTAGTPSQMTLTIPHTGTNLIELRAEPLAGELTDVNNRIVAEIEGIRENLRVLFVSGEPNSGVRMWRSLLKSDPGTDVVHFTILRPPVKQDYTPLSELALIPFPVDELFSQKIKEFDLIIFDHYETQGLLPDYYFQNIVRYVEEGGALLVVSGSEYAGNRSLAGTPLGRILPALPTGPVSDGPFLPQQSETGLRHPVTRDLAPPTAEGQPGTPAWGRWYSMVDSNVQSGQTLMTGADGKPLLVLERRGQGRIGMLLSDNAWLWARGFEGGGPYADLLRQTSHWLMKNPALEEEALTMHRDRDGKLVIEQQTLGTEPGSVTLRSPSGQEQTVTLSPAGPGLFRAVVETAELGLYSAETPHGDQTLKTFISIGAVNPREFVSTLSTAALVAPLVEKTNGSVTRMTAQDGTHVPPRIETKTAQEAANGLAGPGWIGIRMSDASVQRGLERIPLIPAWLGFLASVGMLAGAWYKEGEGKFPGRRRRKQENNPTPG